MCGYKREGKRKVCRERKEDQNRIRREADSVGCQVNILIN